MTNPSKLLLLSPILILTAVTARAGTLTPLILKSVDGVSDVGTSKNTVLQINGNATTFAGLYGLEVDGRSAPGFCVEPDQMIYLNTRYDYEVLSVSAAYSDFQRRINDLELLLGSYGKLPMTPLNSAALQISIWEITGDGDIYDLTGGNFSVTTSGTVQPGGFTTADAIQLANGWLSNLDGDKRAEVTILRNKDAQDLVTWSNVPDGGSTLALCGASLLGLAGARKLAHRKRR